jgi:hypothetical protein
LINLSTLIAFKFSATKYDAIVIKTITASKIFVYDLK